MKKREKVKESLQNANFAFKSCVPHSPYKSVRFTPVTPQGGAMASIFIQTSSLKDCLREHFSGDSCFCEKRIFLWSPKFK